MPENLTPSQQRAYIEQADLPDEVKSEVLAGEWERRKSVTLENSAAEDEIRRMIDRGELQGTYQEKLRQLQALAWDGLLTPGQTDALGEYMQKGGNTGDIKQTELDALFYEFSDHNSKTAPAGFFAGFTEWARPRYAGTPLKGEALREAVAEFMRGGDVPGRHWGRNTMRFDEAWLAGKTDVWLAEGIWEESREFWKLHGYDDGKDEREKALAYYELKNGRPAPVWDDSTGGRVIVSSLDDVPFRTRPAPERPDEAEPAKEEAPPSAVSIIRDRNAGFDGKEAILRGLSGIGEWTAERRNGQDKGPGTPSGRL
jgi:hypothetical protein